MKLSKELGKTFAYEIEKVIQREINNPGYMPQSEFAESKTPCYDRADRMVLAALPAVVDTLALSISNHRVKKHKEKHADEIKTLEATLSDDQINISTRYWWRG